MKARWILSTLAMLPCAFVGAVGGGDEVLPPPRSAAELAPAFAQLVASLEARGAREVHVHENLDFPAQVELPLAPGRCVTAVVVAKTSLPASASFLNETRFPLVESDDAHVSALSICHLPSLPHVTLHVGPGVRGEMSYEARSNGRQSVDVHLFEDDGSSPEALAAGRPSHRWSSELTATTLYAHHRARAVAAEESLPSLLEAEVAPARYTNGEITLEGGALLVPRSATTEAWLREAARFGCPGCEGDPRVHPASARSVVRANDRPDARSDALPDDAAEPAVVDALWHGPDEFLAGSAGSSAFWRVLAVIDPGDLPNDPALGPDVPCATIDLRRFSRGVPTYARVTALADAPTLLDAPTDRFCPGDPPRLYVVPRHDRAVHHVTLRAERESGPRRAGPPPIVGEHARLTEARARCEADARECIRLGRMLHHGTYASPDLEGATVAFTRGCEEGNVGCLELVAHLDALDPRRAFEWLRARCDYVLGLEWSASNGLGDACAALGDRHRLALGTRFDLAAARVAYREGCRLGDGNACRNRDALELLQL